MQQRVEETTAGGPRLFKLGVMLRGLCQHCGRQVSRALQGSHGTPDPHGKGGTEVWRLGLADLRHNFSSASCKLHGGGLDKTEHLTLYRDFSAAAQWPRPHLLTLPGNGPQDCSLYAGPKESGHSAASDASGRVRVDVSWCGL